MSLRQIGLFWLMGIGWLFCAKDLSAAPLTLGEDLAVEVLTDRGFSSQPGSIDTLTAERFQAWPPGRELNLPAGSHWIKAVLGSSTLPGREAWLEISPVLLPQVLVYHRPHADAPWSRQLRASEQSATNRSGAFHLRLAEGSDQIELLIHVRNESRVTLQAKLWTTEDYAIQALRAALQWGLYFGLALMSALLALALAAVLRNRTLLAVSAFGFTYVFSGLQGFIGWWLPPDTFLMSAQVTVAVMILAEIAMIWFAREALDIHQHYPRLDKGILAIISLFLLSLFLQPLWARLPLLPVLYAVSGSTKLLLIGLGFALWYRYAWRYGTGLCPAFCGIHRVFHERLWLGEFTAPQFHCLAIPDH